MLKEQKKQAKNLCEYAEISQNTFSNWKRGRIEPNTKYISSIADSFHVSKRYILTREDVQESYYYDPEVAELVQEIATKPELRVLFKAK